ncbi:erythromycin esterase family protein [Gaetbulibacter sp. M240]|uniref:erythromycin esterase family protein n=1 Tax=Gaetbulibacter sp. M240 TaxID=3126511 RepID=UPI00374EA9FA
MKTETDNALHYYKSTKALVDKVKKHARTLSKPKDLDVLIERIGDARYVLLGEATHGTHEFYLWRAILTKRLIEEKGFSFVGVEGDSPDCYRVNRYVKNYGDHPSNAYDTIREFNRWPTWMWANWEVIEFINWLKDFNTKKATTRKVGFYGLDVYSLGESLEALMQYLEKTDHAAYIKAQEAVKCFEPFGYEGTDYARATWLIPKTCETEVVDLLRDVRTKITSYNTDPEAVFNTEQNALVAVNAEKYYRTMIKGGGASWNVRDRHMVETLERLMDFHGDEAKAIVWAHNTHVGDARATDMSRQGMVNIGELISIYHHADEVFKVGFGTYQGTVIAGRKWGDAMEIMNVPKAAEDSWEAILHQAGDGADLVFTTDVWQNDPTFKTRLDHRAIGVVYQPEYERFGNYVPSDIPLRYDGFIHIDTSSALHPVHIKPDGHQIPETYPWGV